MPLADGASRDVTFTYTATDDKGGVSAPKTVTITVSGTNDVPVASDDSKGTGENAVLSSSVPAGHRRRWHDRQLHAGDGRGRRQRQPAVQRRRQLHLHPGQRL
jgi:hypothetical protein